MPSDAAYHRAWRAKNPDKAKKIQRRYYEKNAATVRASKRRYYYANAERLREQAREWRRRNSGHSAARRKAIKGRICNSCGRNDSESSWSDKQDMCCACGARYFKYGTCKGCGQAKYKDGCHGCKKKPKVSSTVLTLWDAFFCAPYPGTVSWRDLAKIFKLQKSSAQKKLERMETKLREIGVGFTKSLDPLEGFAVLSVNMPALQELVDGEGGA